MVFNALTVVQPRTRTTAVSVKAVRLAPAANALFAATTANTLFVQTASKPVPDATTIPARRVGLPVQSAATASVENASMTTTAHSVAKKKRKKRHSQNSRRRSRHPSRRPTIRFTPYAWAKLLYLRDAGDTEIGGFAVTSPDDLLMVEDVRLVRQRCTAVTVAFDDSSVADYFDEQVDADLKPEQFGRIWLHTHPGDSAEPSTVDEETFDRCFGNSDWSVMFILAQDGATYARLRFNVGPTTTRTMKVEIDYSMPFAAADGEAWQAEYDSNVMTQSPSYCLEGEAWEDEGLSSRPCIDQRMIEHDWFERFDAEPLFPEHEETRWLAALD